MYLATLIPGTFSQVTCGDRDCDGQPCSTAPTDKPIDDYDCPSDGTYPYEDNCIKYILCSNDVAVEQICPIGEKLEN